MNPQVAVAEVEELERLYGADLRATREEMNLENGGNRVNRNSQPDANDIELLELLEKALDAEVVRLGRVGKPGCWCTNCGLLPSESPLVKQCACGFEDFGCRLAGRRICVVCSELGHERVGAFLREMFNAGRRQRIRLFLRLYRATPEMEDVGYPKTPGEKLCFALAQVEEEESRDAFRAQILKAFRRAVRGGFSDFQELAASIEREKQAELSRAALRYLQSESRSQRAESRLTSPVRASAGPNAKGLDFYK